MNPFDVMRLRRAAKVTKFQFVTSGASFAAPADWNNANNKVHCIGAGANGLIGNGTGGSAFGKQGGGGGAYAVKNNVALSGTVTCQIGAANSGVDTFVTSAATVMAKAAAVGNISGGPATTSVGDTKFKGGDGDSGGSTAADPSGGGGGAGGPSGAGFGGSGMTGGDGQGAASGGGVGGAPTGGAGGAGTFWTATVGGATAGPGGGGGGRNTIGVGGIGGAYGGGGGGGYSSSSNGGVAGAGLIVLEWTV